jgi:hypothetical protein
MPYHHARQFRLDRVSTEIGLKIHLLLAAAQRPFRQGDFGMRASRPNNPMTK